MYRQDSQIDFIGIGGPKCGSSWLAQCLKEHPEICFSREKEVTYFNSSNYEVLDIPGFPHFRHGPSWYLKQFPRCKENQKRGEFSPSYLADDLAPERIKELCPDTKLLLIFRNPVDVLYSFYHMIKVKLNPRIPMTFEECVEQKLLHRYSLFGQYLQNYLDIFPKEQFHFMIYEEVIQNPQLHLQELFRFLEVDPNFRPPSLKTKVNEAMSTRSLFLQKTLRKGFHTLEKAGLTQLSKGLRKNGTLYRLYAKANIGRGKYEPMSKLMRARLINEFLPDTELLERQIDKKLDIWKK